MAKRGREVGRREAIAGSAREGAGVGEHKSNVLPSVSTSCVWVQLQNFTTIRVGWSNPNKIKKIKSDQGHREDERRVPSLPYLFLEPTRRR